MAAGIPAFPVYLFDVDGTLVDSAADICGAIQTVLATTPRAEVGQDYLKRYIGYHLIDLFQDLFPETIAALPGRKSTATTKGTPTTRAVLDKFGLLPFFHHVQGTDGFPCKPAPDVIHKSLEVFAVHPKDCLLIGDAAPDMEAGRRAGVKTCAVRYGYGDHTRMAEWEPDYWIDDIAEVLPR
jgi:phosphoglycolate phosphatase